jgi:hypothetical protein
MTNLKPEAPLPSGTSRRFTPGESFLTDAAVRIFAILLLGVNTA